MKRRQFLREAAFASAGLALPGWTWPHKATSTRAVRVRGLVRSQGKPLARIALTDGRTVTQTGVDGSFELITSAGSEFVSVTLPAGYRIPRNQSGTSRIYQPIRPNRSGETDVLFDLERLPHADEKHQLFLLSDPQTRDEEEMRWFQEQTIPDVRQLLNAGSGESFGIGCGDLVYDRLDLLPAYERAVNATGMPFFQVIGNHDVDRTLTDATSARTFRQHFGPTYYSFDRGAIHYVVLDNVFWHGPENYLAYLDDEQLAWLAADLALVEPGRSVVVIQHIPAMSTRQERLNAGGQTVNRELLYRLLEPYKVHILSGHTHENEHTLHGGTHEHIHGTVCGAWWSGPLCRDGTPNGYAVYTMSGETVSWQYKATGRPLDHQLRAYRRGADAAAPEEIVANVWDWDPSWTVLWYEDGARRGTMTRRTALDPLTVELYAGSSKPQRRPKMEPEITTHMFFARVSPGAREIRVEATDGAGRTYSEIVP